MVCLTRRKRLAGPRYDGSVRALWLALAALAMPLAGADPLVNQAYDHFYNLEFDQAIAFFERGHRAPPGFGRPAQPPGAEHRLPGNVPRWLARKRARLGQQFFSAAAQAESHPGDGEAVLGRDRQGHGAVRGAPAAESQGHAAHVRPGDLLRAAFRLLLGGEKGVARFAARTPPARAGCTTAISELEPDNVDARLVQGLHDYIVGSLPWHTACWVS